MRVLTFQSYKLDLSFKNNDKIFADENLCNYPNAKEIYKRLILITIVVNVMLLKKLNKEVVKDRC